VVSFFIWWEEVKISKSYLIGAGSAVQSALRSGLDPRELKFRSRTESLGKTTGTVAAAVQGARQHATFYGSNGKASAGETFASNDVNALGSGGMGLLRSSTRQPEAACL
jgi:hypothetical protein